MQKRRIKDKHPKVRSGCLTCKARHVKCDETKPVCVRCSTGGYRCEGYTQQKAWIFEYTNDKPTHETKSSSDGTDTINRASSHSSRKESEGSAETSATSDLDVAPGQLGESLLARRCRFIIAPSSPYRTLEEQRVIKRFFEVTSPMLCRYSDPEVWNIAIPQSAWEHNAVRHSLIAATLADEDAASEVRRPSRRETTLSHMNAAVRSLIAEKPSIEVVLMTGLILQLFETLNQNASIALVHLRSAMKILAEYKQRIANGEHFERTQRDFVIGRLQPVLEVACQFAEVTLEGAEHQAQIDQHTSIAYDLRARMTRPGVVDSFRNLLDARNNLGTQALKLTQLMAPLASDGSTESRAATGVTLERDQISLSYEDYIDAQGRLQHFWRLLKPIYKDEPAARMLKVHFTILSMMLDDIKPLDLDTNSPEEDVLHLDSLASEAQSLTLNDNVRHSDLFKVELGFIPPLFYLATTSRQCSLPARRQAIHCLGGHLKDLTEGAWDGEVAGRVAEKIVGLRDDRGTAADTLLEVFDQLPTTSPYTSTNVSRGVGYPDLWTSQSIEDLPATQDAVTSPATEPMSAHKYLSWTEEELKTLPRNIDELIRNAGYQGYFSDAAAAAAN